jgi:CheY-like chemotaxis protein
LRLRGLTMGAPDLSAGRHHHGPRDAGGIEATRRLKRNTRTRDILVVVLTSFPWRADEALIAGCAAFLTKPCTPHDLCAVLENAIDRQAS